MSLKWDCGAILRVGGRGGILGVKNPTGIPLVHAHNNIIIVELFIVNSSVQRYHTCTTNNELVRVQIQLRCADVAMLLVS